MAETCALKSSLDLEYINDHGTARIIPHWDENALRNCPVCGGIKYIQSTNDKGYRIVRPCPGQFALNRVDAYNQARIPSRFMQCTFDNYSTRYLPKTVVNTYVEFRDKIKAYKKGDRGYLLEGGPGTGKTHLLCAAIHYLTLEMGVLCRYIDYSNLLSEIRASYGKNVSEFTHIDPLTSVPVLFIDELGKGRDKANDFEIRIIDEIINRRYLDPDLTTLFASNYRDRSTSGYDWYVQNGYNPESDTPMSSRKWQDFIKDTLKKNPQFKKEEFEDHVKTVMKREHIEDRVSDRTASRILSMAIPKFIDASDYRRRQQIDK